MEVTAVGSTAARCTAAAVAAAAVAAALFLLSSLYFSVVFINCGVFVALFYLSSRNNCKYGCAYAARR